MRVAAITAIAVAATALFLPSRWSSAQSAATNIIHIDATAPVPPPQPVAAALGTSTNPAGHVLSVNSQYLTLDGKPWLPVMGEFHFSRYPESQWEREILKMKAAGVQIIATYVIWIHHEQTQGQFDWSGQRDLRHFVELCGKHGLYVYPRIGPWAHAEVRNGGLPDWVVQADNIRQNDPGYLAKAKTFYGEIGKQLRGQLWKDGGPVIGVQIENEYRETGPGKGAEHIRTLKQMAIAAGIDVPLYTVTGWDGAAIPLDSVLPVFGGYPDAPWDGSPRAEPPAEIYAFRFDNRAAGNMGAIGGSGQNASSSYRQTPFLTAEIGAGIQDTYFRRPVVSANDIAAIVPVMLGSGANLLGYYMFHGGRNPDGGAITLQESQATGYPTDVPVRSYDFQAPLGEFGQESGSLRKLKLYHYFLEGYGRELAPMTPRKPNEIPESPADTSVARVSARTNGDSGFLFLDNYVRDLPMPVRPGFQVRLALPSGVMQVPERPVDLPANCFGIWPVNLALGKQTLRYSTAQLLRRVETHGETYIFFFAIPGVTPEFSFRGQVGPLRGAHGAGVMRAGDSTIVRVSDSGGAFALADGTQVVVLSEKDAEDIWKVDDPSVLVQTSAYAYSDGGRWTLESTGTPHFKLGVFGKHAALRSRVPPLRPQPRSGLFRRYSADLPPVRLSAQLQQVSVCGTRAPWKPGPAVAWRKERIAMAPDDADFSAAGKWKLALPAVPDTLADAYLEIHYDGDVARMREGPRLLDDNFWNGIPWTVGLTEIGARSGGSFALQVLPLPQTFPMYIQAADRLQFTHGVACSLTAADLVPQYRLVLDATQ